MYGSTINSLNLILENAGNFEKLNIKNKQTKIKQKS